MSGIRLTDDGRRSRRLSQRDAGIVSRTLLDGIGDGILVADSRRRYVDANHAACRLLGYTRDEVLRLAIDDIVINGPTLSEAEFARLTRDGSWRGDLELRHRNGSTVLVEAHATTVNLPHDIQ